ncbi:uncharacterized protein LOC135377449 [Ornithodoros turicata]|uniref:uncharacterized protein LOC135377449 n=1 Tax=Ornithodoros turicata TaxID=34597 RepID=UPI003138DBFE
MPSHLRPPAHQFGYCRCWVSETYFIAFAAMAYSLSIATTATTDPNETRGNRTKVDDFVNSVAQLPFLNPLFIPPVVLDHKWGGVLRVLNGRITGIRSLHRTEAVVMRFATSVDLRSVLEMGPLYGVLSVVISPAQGLSAPFGSSSMYYNRRTLSFDARAVTMNFSAGTDFDTGRGRLYTLALKKIVGLNVTIDKLDTYGSLVNLFTSVLKRHVERFIRYLVEDVLRSIMSETIRYADLSAENLMRTFVHA